MRILHAPSNPADQAGLIVRALRTLGHEAELWHYGQAPFGFEVDRSIDVSADDLRPQWNAFMEAIERFDVFHFQFARTFFSKGWGGVPPYWDLPLLRLLGKKIFFTFAGNDVRLKSVLGEHNPWTEEHYADLVPDEDRVRKSISVFRAYADELFVLSAELSLYVPFATYMPRAMDLAQWPAAAPRDREVPVVLHAPSRRSIKGSSRILAEMEALRNEGLGFDLRIVEGVSHDAVRKEMYDADIVIDQLLCGDFGIVSVEAMASSNVAVAYLLDVVRDTMPGLPVYHATPEDFRARMRSLILDRSVRRSLATAGRAYVEENFDSMEVARKHLVAYEREPAAPPSGGFPDWVSFGDERKLEALEERVRSLTLSRAQAQERARTLLVQMKSLKQELARSKASSFDRLKGKARDVLRKPER